MARNHLTFSRSLQLLQALGALEPGGMISSQPTLRDTVAPVLDHVAMITDEEEGATVRHVDLHSNQAIGVAWQVMQCNALAEIKSSVVEGLPVSARGQNMCLWQAMGRHTSST